MLYSDIISQWCLYRKDSSAWLTWLSMITEMSVSRFFIAKSFRSLFFLSDVHRLRILVEEIEKLLRVFLCSVFIAFIAYLVSAAEL